MEQIISFTESNRYSSKEMPAPRRAIECKERAGSWFTMAIFATDSDCAAMMDRLEQDVNDPYKYRVVIIR